MTILEEKEIWLPQLPVLVGLPEERPGLPPHLKANLQNALLQVFTKQNIPFKIEFIEQGHTACLSAFEKAMILLPDSGFCIVGGVDSYDNIETIEWLEHDIKRLFCTTVEDGFIPGQSAGFVLLASEDAIRKHQIKPLAKILSVAGDEEANSFESNKMSTGKALSQTFKQLLKAIPENVKIDEIYSTQNGEKYSAQEFAYAITNIGPRIKEVGNLIAPYNRWGDLGAASVPVLLGIMTEAGKKGYAKGPLNLISAANLGNKRAGALIELLNLK
ncbi:MAG: hypothetical protein MJE63_25980 [Proteobacteria bacterium]|nr:hypothetical protein [Pseudomonadota bacterium]